VGDGDEIAWNSVNSSHASRARLYLNAEYRGATSRVNEQFSWIVEKVNFRLGTGHYIGLADDLLSSIDRSRPWRFARRRDSRGASRSFTCAEMRAAPRSC
jgi:hypothetical protein